MLNDPHSLGTSLAKNLTIINVDVVFDIIRHLSIVFIFDSSTKEDRVISHVPLRVFYHTLGEGFTFQNGR
jgi:hypothetical protein